MPLRKVPARFADQDILTRIEEQPANPQAAAYLDGFRSFKKGLPISAGAEKRFNRFWKMGWEIAMSLQAAGGLKFLN